MLFCKVSCNIFCIIFFLTKHMYSIQWGNYFLSYQICILVHTIYTPTFIRLLLNVWHLANWIAVKVLLEYKMTASMHSKNKLLRLGWLQSVKCSKNHMQQKVQLICIMYSTRCPTVDVIIVCNMHFHQSLENGASFTLEKTLQNYCKVITCGFWITRNKFSNFMRSCKCYDGL